ESALECPKPGSLADEAQAVPECKPQQRADTGARDTLRHGGEHVLLTNHPAVEQRESRDGHHQNERARSNHPCCVSGVDLRGSSLRKSRQKRPHKAHDAPASGSANYSDCVSHLLPLTCSGYWRARRDSSLEGVDVGLARPDANGLVDWSNEDFAVADLAGLGR